MVALKEKVEAQKIVPSLAYFQERLEELVVMGVELLNKGREANWALCKEKVLILFKVIFPEMDLSQIDPDLSSTEVVVNTPLIDSFSDPEGCSAELAKDPKH